MSVHGGNKAKKIFANASRQAETAVERALIRGALLIERDAKILAPVDTGRLRASITHRLEGNSGKPSIVVGTNVEYAKAVEFGHSGMTILPKNKKALSWIPKAAGVGEFQGSNGKTVRKRYYKTKDGSYTLNSEDARVFAKKVVIPPRAARPFLHPAFRKNKENIRKMIADVIRKETRGR